MPLPIPNLDDRTFQGLVDEAKRLVQRRCPEWTDHNVSDPGVTLIETFASMTDQVIYRLNRIPDRFYVKFLELIGVRLFPATAAHAAVTFWLSAPPEETLHIPTGTRVATLRTETDPAITFTTFATLPIIPCALARVATMAAGSEQLKDASESLLKKEEFACFGKVPKPGDALVVGLTEAIPNNAVTLRFNCDIEGVGVDPNNPPLRWEAWDGERWTDCEVDRDATGGLNRDGDVVVHVPAGHVIAVFDGLRAAWLRARVTEADQDQPTYGASPTIKGLSAFTIGGTTDAAHAELIEAEPLGVSEGVSSQRFTVRRGPVLAGAGTPSVETSSEEGWAEWTAVPDFTESGPADRHFVLDAVAGEVVFGPAVRLADGSLHHYGAVPDKGVQIRLRSYGVGGGRMGNVAKGAISVLKSSIPYVASVGNRRPSQGGVDGEDIENAKVRGPIVLRTRGRAVTAEDYEFLAREAAPGVARVRCVSAGEGVDAGSVRVLVVPAVEADAGRLRFEQLVPPQDLLESIVRRLDECRLIGARVLVEPPLYRGITVVARLRSRPRASGTRLQAAALDALFAYLNPLTGGPDGDGWPFGRAVHSGEVYAVLQALSGTELVEDVRIFGADPITGRRGQAAQRLELEPHALVFSYEHQVLVDQG